MLNKDRVTELVVQSGLHEFGGHNREKFLAALAYFATAIQHEALKAVKRGDAEPVAWMVTSEMQDGSRQTYPLTGKYKHVCDACDFGEPIPLYTHPTPAVVRQLVEALETLVGWEEAEAAHFEAEGPDDWIMDKARRALAAVKDTRL